jgi:hypothetical protein
MALNAGVGIPQQAPSKVEANAPPPSSVKPLPPGATPSGRFR